MSHLLTDRKPVVAVLTVGDHECLFRGNKANFKDILNTGNDLDFPVYVVTTKDLKLSAKRVQGYHYDPDDKIWSKQWFPLPDVIYNRIPQREDERKRNVRQKIKEIIQHKTIHIYNPYFFNKRKLFEWLKKNRSTRALVPDTKRLLGPRSLASMLKTYERLYLKPESGKAGKGIMLLQYEAEHIKPYRLTIQGQRYRHIVYRTAKLASLWNRIKAEMKDTPYIMQEGIQLTPYKERNFDLRVLVQKTGKGVWMVTGVGARLAGLKRITTHVPQGGSIESPEKLLTPSFGNEMTTVILHRLKSNAVLIAKQIEKASGHLLGEMSMDLGIDTEGNMWFFEANSKPMKFDEPQIRKKSLERIFQYSQHLVNQSKNSVH
ncbi:YheC/YheD family endospore coat-associated protein [Paenibacillus bouchesdurhonensis]|uniref:YheC/YheD family endospore coat-associated protein n=1 Tax=Paenibacillus bouchesdurhonensis TaxID=1870990 RepID=UPI000DA627D4|nr:YheC/YheD family protein [Paenibacillus bouchesdurhonensis]